MGNKIEKLSSTLGNLLRARGMQSNMSEYRILGQWEKTVGEVIARHARPAAVRGKKLFLTVDSPAWMQQLSLLKPEIIEKVNRNLGKDLIKEIGLNLGEVQQARVPSSNPGPRPELTNEDRVRIEQVVGEIADPTVRQAVRRVMEKDCISKKGKR